MPGKNHSLPDLEQLITQGQEQIQRLQLEIKQRKTQLAEWTAVRQKLEQQLREVNWPAALNQLVSRNDLDISDEPK